MPITAHDTTVVFGTSAFAATLLGLTPPGAERGSYDTSTLATSAWMTQAAADLAKAKNLKMHIEFDPTTYPPITAAAETITITWSDGSTWVFTGFIVDYSPTDGVSGERMEGDVEVAVSGTITVNPAT